MDHRPRAAALVSPVLSRKAVSIEHQGARQILRGSQRCLGCARHDKEREAFPVIPSELEESLTIGCFSQEHNFCARTGPRCLRS